MAGAHLRGILAGLSGLGFVLAFLFLQTRVVPLSVVVAVAGGSLLALVIAGGRPALRRLAGHPTTGDTGDRESADWWLARIEPALEDAWTIWSDLVLAVGLGIVGLAAFAILVTSPSNDPPLGLLIVGFIGINGALISLAMALT